MDLERLRRAATELPAWVFRAKGSVYLHQRPRHRALLQVVGRRARVDRGAAWGEARPETELVCVGSRRGFDARAVARHWQACEAGESPSVWRRLFGAAG
jgi:G3E family GTPase